MVEPRSAAVSAHVENPRMTDVGDVIVTPGHEAYEVAATKHGVVFDLIDFAPARAALAAEQRPEAMAGVWDWLRDGGRPADVAREALGVRDQARGGGRRPRAARGGARAMSDRTAPPPRIDWRGADLRGVNLQGVNLEGADLRAGRPTVREPVPHEPPLRRPAGASLQQANFQYATLYGAKMQGVEAQMADFHGADLRQANLAGAYLDGVMMPAPEVARGGIEELRAAFASNEARTAPGVREKEGRER